MNEIKNMSLKICNLFPSKWNLKFALKMFFTGTLLFFESPWIVTVKSFNREWRLETRSIQEKIRSCSKSGPKLPVSCRKLTYYHS